MSGARVAIIDYVFPNVDPERSILEPLGAEVVEGQCKTLEDVVALASSAFALMTCYYKPLDETVFTACPGVRMIVRYGVGVDTIDLDAAARCGVMVVNVPTYCQDDVADHTCALLLGLVRKITLADQRVKRGSWDLEYMRPLFRLRGRRAGFIGFGRIARMVAARMAAFGLVDCTFFDPYVAQADAPGCTKEEALSALLAGSDVLLLHAPETPETRHLLNRETLAQTKRGALLVNTARGGLVDTEALIDALASGHLGGAALDVLEGVPPLAPSSELLSMENVILTPHAGFYSEESLHDLQTQAAEEVARVLQGGTPLSVVNPQVLRRR